MRAILPLIAVGSSLLGTGPEPPSSPLQGAGSGFEIVGNLPVSRGPGGLGVAATDIELHGHHAFIGAYHEGMVIADVSNPASPVREGVFDCPGGTGYDVQLHPALKFAVLTTDSPTATCFPRAADGSAQEGAMILGLADLEHPTLLSAIPMAEGAHTATLDGDVLYVSQYSKRHHRIELFDLRDPARPRKLSEVDFGPDRYASHDLITDHRPDGRTLVYAASIAYTDAIDATDPRRPRLLQRIQDPNLAVSHQAEPNHARDVLVVSDEFNGAAPADGCGRAGVQDAASEEPGTPEYAVTGALHFYRLDSDGTIFNNGQGIEGKHGVFRAPGAPPDCTAHVFWQAPAENRLLAAWYRAGVRLVNFANPTVPAELASFVPSGANTWAAKAHKGYVYTGDIVRGMDVLRYTGEGWPATSGPMEDQRRRQQGNFANPPKLDPEPTPGSGFETPGYGGAEPVPTPPPGSGGTQVVTADKPAPPLERDVGGARWSARVRVPGKRGRKKALTVTFVDAQGALVHRLRFKARAGRTHRLRGVVAAVVGRYRFVVRVGEEGRNLYVGRLNVRLSSRPTLRLSDRRVLVCRLL